MTDPTDASPDLDPALIPPPEVQSILDEASEPGGSYSARPTTASIQLVDTRTGQIIREAIWARAGKWATNVLRNSLAAVRDQNQP